MTALAPVTLCIVNRNGARHLPATLAAVAGQHWRFAEIVVVDDASTDSSLERVAEAAFRCRIVRLDSSRGPGAARNAGFVAATHDRVLFLDNDVRLGETAVERLVAALEAHPAALLVAPRVVYECAPDVIQYDSADCHFLGLMIPRHADRPAGATGLEPAATDSLVTACFLIDRRRWSGGPLFDETFGFNLEDHDFGVRARLRGHELRVEPRACVRHGDGTAGLSYRPGAAPSADRVFHLVRNRWLVIGKSFSGRTLLLLAPALVLFELAQLGMLALNGMGHTWCRALVSLAGRWPSLLDGRREVQRTRRVADRALIRGGPLPFTGWVRAGRLKRLAVGVLAGGTDANWRLVRRFL